MTVRRYLLLTKNDTAFLQQRITAAFSRWRRDWCAGGDGDTAEIDLCKKSDSPLVSTGIDWQIIAADVDLAVGVATADSDAFVSALAGNPVTNGANGKQLDSGIAEDLRRKSLHALAMAFLDESGAVAPGRSIDDISAPPVDDIWKDSQGFIVARCRIAQVEIYVMLYPRLTGAYLSAETRQTKRRSHNMVRRQSVLVSQMARLEISAGSAELTLSELTTLTVGDVVTLNRHLKQPMLVTLGNSAVICEGYLGTQGEQKAVQLTSISESNEV